MTLTRCDVCSRACPCNCRIPMALCMAEHFLHDLLDNLRRDEAVIRAGGGTQAIQRQHEKGRLTARERITHLTEDFFELGLWAAWQMYADWGGAPSARVCTCG